MDSATLHRSTRALRSAFSRAARSLNSLLPHSVQRAASFGFSRPQYLHCLMGCRLLCNWQPEDLDNLPRNLAPALLRYRAATITKISFAHQNELMTTYGGLPVQPVAFVQHDFVAFRRARDRPTGRGKKDINLFDVGILRYLVRRKNNSWMVSLPERITENVPLLHGSLLGS